MLIEEQAEWPELCNRIVFIAKTTGGVRPIGLLFAIVRVQCRLRRFEAKLWEAAISDGFFWATHARGVERCVWEQAAWSEWSSAGGHAVATILYDLLKAFDHVAYQKLIDAAVRTRFPMRQLKLLLQVYRAPRHVELDGVAGKELRVQRGIIPGCAFATTLLQLLLVGPLREVRAAHPTVSIRVVVDDLSLQRFGDQHRVVQELEGASSCLARVLKLAGCEIATKKSKVLSNTLFVRAKLQTRLAPLGVKAVQAERNLGSDYTSGKRASSAVRRARLEKSKGRVKRIRKLHGPSSVPLRQRLARIAQASVARVNHYGVSVTGLNETQLQQSRSQMASCLTKRMHGKSVTMVLMAAGEQLDPIFDSLAPIVALTHAVWDNWMPQAAMAKCLSKARDDQRDNLRPWTAVKGPFGAAVATLKRLQWVILERDPFLWCMHDGRVADPRRVCPHSMLLLLRRAAQAWQWRRVALHEGYESLSRGAVFAPLFRALHSSELSMAEKAYLRSAVVDGQWTQQRKFRAGRTWSPLCMSCGSEEGSLAHRHFRCPGEPGSAPCVIPSPFRAAAESGKLWELDSFASRALLPAPPGRPLGYMVPYDVRWQGDRSLVSGVVYGDGAAYEGQDSELCVAGWGLVATAAAGNPVTVSGTLPYLIQDVDGAELFASLMFLRLARAPAQYVTDSSIVEQGVNKRGRAGTVSSAAAWADLWRDVWSEIAAWGGLVESLSVRKVKVHTSADAVAAGLITAHDRAGNDLADAACKLVVFEHRAPPSIRAARLSAGLAVGRMAQWIARVGSIRQRQDVDETWLPGRGRVAARGRVRARPWPLPPPLLPAVQLRGHHFVDGAAGRICVRCQHPERTSRGKCPGTSGTRARSAAVQHRLEGAAGHRIVDLVQGGKVVSVLCAVCGSYGGRVVRRSLLSSCPGAPTPGRRLALRDVLLGFLPGSKRAARLDSIPGEVRV